MARTFHGTTFRILIAFFLAYGWNWATVLKEWGYITDVHRKWILGLTGVLFLGQQVIQNIGKPANRSAVASRRDVIETYLKSFLVQYYDTLKNAQTLPLVRVNLALPTRHRWFWKRLKIYYQSCPELGAAYNGDELAMKFKKLEGTCGQAWGEKTAVIFDSTNQDLSSAKKSLRKQNQPHTASIMSVLSVPVMENGHVVGVLSVDSKFSCCETKFNRLSVIQLAQAYANALGPFCFSDGVK